MTDDIDAFDEWAQATVRAAALQLVRLVPDDAHPNLQGEGQAVTSGRGYRSHYVGMTSPRIGTVSVWLFAVPAGHRYNDSRQRDRLGAGLMRSSEEVVREAALGPKALRRPGGFRWRKPSDEWESYLLYIDANSESSPEEAAQRLAEQAFAALKRDNLLP